MASSFSMPKSILITTFYALTVVCSSAIATDKRECTFPGLAGTYPVKLQYVLNQLKEVASALKAGTPVPPGLKNRLLMYGPPGNGKTTIARTMAEQAGCHFLYINGPEIVNKYVGQGAENIKALFNEAREHADLDSKPVVIAIDEIDAFAANTDSEHRGEHKATCEALWGQLDQSQSDNRLFFVCMTNSSEINSILRTRFGNNIEEIGAPNEATRREVLQLYKQQYTGTPWEKELLDTLVKKSDNKKISIRFLQDYVQELYIVAKNEHNGLITSEFALTLFEEMKNKYIESLGQWLYNKKGVIAEKTSYGISVASQAIIAIKSIFGPDSTPPQTQTATATA